MLGLVSHRVYLLTLGTTALTLVLTPFILRLMPQLLAWRDTVPWLKRYLDEEDSSVEVIETLPAHNHIVICGYERD
jgi:CPA2 family monovalent cation:H+ antiporter-2